MAAAPRYASLDGADFDDETIYFGTSENALARRSVSIFSRRGVEERPEPRPPFIAQAAMRTPREMTERQKSWMKRRSAPVLSSSPKKSRGTILNAVPSRRTLRMTPLEEEMASSSNGEVLSAIDSPSSPQLASASPLTPQSGPFWAIKDVLPNQRTKSSKRTSTETRIGVWINGIVHWDETARSERSIGFEEPSLPATGFTPIQPASADQPNIFRGSRPQLSVLIPGARPRVSDRTISTIVLNSEMPRRPFVSVAPANLVSKFAASSSTGAHRIESQAVSPLETPALPPTPQIIVEDEHGTKKNASRQSRASSFESSLLENDDTSSNSRQSSVTSIEADHTREHDLTPDSRTQTGSRAFSTVSPAVAGVFEKAARKAVDINKPLPPRPNKADTREASRVADQTSRLRHATSTKSESDLRPEHPKPSWRMIELEAIDSDSARTSSYLLSVSAPASPTLSQAEQDLETELSLTAKDGKIAEPPTKQDSVRRRDSVRSVMQPPERAPTVPRRSRRRDWRLSCNLEHAAVQSAKPKDPRRRRSETDLRRPLDHVEDDCAAQQLLRKSCSSLELSRVNSHAEVLRSPVQVPSNLPQVAYEDGLIVLERPVTLQKVMDDASLTAASAEEALLHILEALPSTADLFNTASINKGMYRVYKENEMDLIRAVTRNQSPAAFEFREWCPPEPHHAVPQSAISLQLEHTSLTYMRSHRRDLAVIEGLKVLILERCQTFIRRETAFALLTPTHPNAQRYDDAFWRIWCFCQIFGTGKGREEDVTGQLDWLKGGLLANNSDLSATMNMNLEFEMSSVLLNPPEYFAKSNEGGLDAQQLYDVIEIWGCLTSLLQPYQGQTRLATRYGVYDSCEVFDGDDEREEYLLEEWTAHLLTLGPAVVLEMARLGLNESAAGFALAKASGWTDWTPPQYSGSRTSFLKEPVSRLYEERVAAAAMTLQNPAEREKKEMSRKRVATLAAEIRVARQSSTYKRLPLIDQTNERAMSILSRHGSTASNFSFRAPSPALTRSSSVSQRRTSTAPHFSTPRPLEPKTLVHSQHHRRKISPIIEDKVESFNRMSAAPGIAENTSERAVRRIMDMGFSSRQAKRALRETDMGDGLRLDRAVEMLLART